MNFKLSTFITCIFLFFSILNANAQFESGDNLVGGSVGVGFGSNINVFSITPRYHRFLNENISVGVSLQYDYRRVENYSPNYEYRTLEGLGISPNIRYHFKLGEKFYLFGQADFMYFHNQYDAIGSNGNFRLSNSHHLSFNFRPGILFMPTKRFGIDLTVDILNIRWQDYNNYAPGNNYNSSGFSNNFGINQLSPKISLYFKF